MSRRWISYGRCLFVAASLGLFLYGCADNTALEPARSETVEPTAPAPGPTATPAAEPEGTAPPSTRTDLIKAINMDLRGDLLELDLSHEGQRGHVYVRWDIATDSTNDAIIDGARADTVTILRAIARSDIDYQDVLLSGWYTIIIDINLNTQYLEVLNLYYTIEKLEPRNWDSIRAGYIWVIADQGSVHWLFQE